MKENETRNSDTLAMNRSGWNAISAAYQKSTQISTEDVHYGVWAKGEKALRLLGDVRGKRILEVGCGGGQDSIALAKWGAYVVGLDPSEEQIKYARALAAANDVNVIFEIGIAEDLSMHYGANYDIVLSSYAFDYVTDLRLAYDQIYQVLRSGGLFVFCLSHPMFQAVGWYLGGDPGAPEIRNYRAWPATEDWDWKYDGQPPAHMRDHLRTTSHLFNDLVAAGFTVERIIEQGVEDLVNSSPEEIAALPYRSKLDTSSKEYEIMRKLPDTILFIARKS